MDNLSDGRHPNRNHYSQLMTDYNKNSAPSTTSNKGKKEILLKSCNNYSVLKQNYGNGQLKNISINFGFPNSKNTYKYKNAFPVSRYPIYEQRNIFYYDKDFQLFKNKSVSKYGEKRNKNNASIQSTRNNRLFSPQHKIVTSIKKKKFQDESEDKSYKKKEKDIYELEVVNTILYDDEDNIEKKEYQNEEWGEIEQEMYVNEKDKKNNLLNSVFVEIEKDDGDKQLKVVEISKDEKKPCIKIKYTIEDKICLKSAENAGNDGGEDLISIYDKDTKDSIIKSPNYKTDTNSTFNNNYSNFNNYSINSLGRGGEGSNIRNVSNISNILLKDSKTTHLSSSRDDNNIKDNIYFSGIPSTEKYQRYSNYKEQYEQKKEKVRPGTYNHDKRFESTQPNRYYKDQTEGIIEKKKKLIDIMKKEPGREYHNNKYIEIKSLRKEGKLGIKTPKQREDRKEIQINIERGLNSLKLPLRDEKSSINTYSPRFNIDDITKSIREKYGDKSRKQSIADDKELKIINIDIKKNRFGNDKYSNLSSRISPKKIETKSFIRDQDRNNYFLTRKKSIDTTNLLQTSSNKYLAKSTYIKDETKKKTLEIEKPITPKNIIIKSRFDEVESKNAILKPNISDNSFNIKNIGLKDNLIKRDYNAELIKNRMNTYKTERKEKDNYSEYRPKIDTKINIEDIISKKEGFKRSFAEKDILVDNILGKKGLVKTKSENQFTERHRFNTYQNKKQLEHSIGSIDRDILKIDRKWGDIGTIKEKDKKAKEKEEKDRLDRERKEKERRDRERKRKGKRKRKIRKRKKRKRKN